MDEPNIGIWYYIWLKPNWELRFLLRKLDDPKNVGHVKFWQSLVEEIDKHYSLTDEGISTLRGLPYGMPRGRVELKDATAGRVLTPQTVFVLYHGNDFPLPKQAEIKTLITSFDLVPFALEHRVIDAFTDHETTVEEHRKKTQEILGPIPYGGSDK
jgi:hypothetical protein